jgi:hypothetical protein
MRTDNSGAASFALSVAWVLWLVPTVLGQGTLGTIRGVATDPSGAVVPGVKITVGNESTGISKTAETDATGNYEVPNLIPGSYTVTAESAGFKKFENKRVALSISGLVRVDIVLELGQPQTQVTVKEGSTLVETDSANIYTFRSEQQVKDLPFNFRTFGGGTGDSGIPVLFTISSGAYSQGDNTSNFIYAGTRTGQQSTAVEGIQIEAPTSGWTMVHMIPSIESVREVKVQPSTLSAEYARSGNVEIATKSGGNEWHGSLFEYHNNGAVNAKPRFATRRTRTTSNAFGGSISGPVVRNRTFFFFVYEGQIDRTPATLAPTVPTLRMREGDFSRLFDSKGNLIVIRNPFTGQPFVDNVIPPDMLQTAAAQVSRNYQDRFYPNPNYGSPDSTSGNWRGIVPLPLDHHEFSGRMDHKVSDANSMFVRVGTKRTFRGQNAGSLPTTGPNDQVRWPYLIAASDTHVFRPTLVNEFRFSYNRERNHFRPPLKGLELVDLLGIQGLLTPPDRSAVPAFSISGFTTVGTWGEGDWRYKTQQFADTVSWIRGRHTSKFGVDIRRRNVNSYSISDSVYGSFTFNGAFTGYSYADFLLGLPQTTGRVTPNPDVWTHNLDFGFFWQDDFKVTTKLTMNFGIRYDVQTVYRIDDWLMASFDPATGRVLVPNDRAISKIHPLFPKTINVVTSGEAGFPEKLRYADKNNFAPRLGLAYRPFGRADFVVRAGYGIFTDNLPSGIALGPQGLFSASETFTNRIVDGTPLYQFPSPFGQVGAVGSQSISALNPNFRNPYLQQWNFSIEKELYQTLFRVAYVGTQSVMLGYRRNINRPPASTTPYTADRRPYPQLINVLYGDNGATQTYNGLQFEAERRMAAGLSFQAGYTWQKTLTDADDEGTPWGPQIEDPYNRMRYKANSAWVPRQRLTLNSIYQLPFGKGRRWMQSGPVSHILGGWQISGMAAFQTGLFFSPGFSGSDPSNTNWFGGLPDRIGDGNLPVEQRVITRWFDATAFAVPPAGSGRFGNSGRNILEGPGEKSVNLGLFKEFAVKEHARLRFEATATNVANHPNFLNPAANISAPGSVGTINSTRSFNDGAGYRTVRFGLRLDY